jgi:tetratricopeptide (TPR) repeat protein
MHPKGVGSIAGAAVAAIAWGLLFAPALAARQAAAGGDVVAQMAQGDAAWNRRADGHAAGTGRALPGPIGEAIAAYQRALKEQPERLEVYWKLLRAMHYRGEYVVATREDKQAVFGAARDVAEAGIERLSRKAGGRARFDALAPAAAAKALAGVPEAAPILLWAGIHWALWGDNFGRLAAARQGVGDRVRRYCEVVIALDERYGDAGGHRLLGRLHTLAPKVPFITGWIDRDKAVSELRQAYALAPAYPLNAVFLADALLQYQPGKAAQARRMLHDVLDVLPAPDRVVEDEDAAKQARQLLEKYPG